MKKLISVLIGFTISLFVTSTTFAAVFFDPQQIMETDFQGSSATPYDFNNDGKMDLISGSSGVISILLGNGDGTFQKFADTNVGFNLSFAVADFNNDGKVDLATLTDIYWEYGVLSIYLGNGDGTFQYISHYINGDNLIFTLTTGDFNGDGIMDIAAGGYAVLLGNGDGTFQSVGGCPGGSLIAKDLNNDGKDDLLAAADDRVHIFISNGDGTFRGSSGYFLGYWAGGASLTVGDYNRDGITDLVMKFGTYAPWPGYYYVRILLGNGDGTFYENANYSFSGFTIGSPTTFDANGDKISDILMPITDGYSGETSVLTLLGDGNGRFPVQTKDIINRSLFAITDFNNDNKADLALANSESNLSIILNTYGGEPAGSITINNDAASTNSTLATLSLEAIDDSGTVMGMRFSNDEDTWSEWEAYAATKSWSLSSGFGTKTICVQFRDADNKVSPNTCDTIYLDPTTPAEVAQMIEDMVASGEISDSGVANALISLLNKAQVQYENDRSSAKNMLMAAVKILEEQSGWRKNLNWQTAQKLIGYLNNIISEL